MKNNIERLVKEALEQHKSPYNEGAWESMSQHLAAKKSLSTFQWSLITGISAAVLVVAALIFNSENQISERTNQIQKSASSSIAEDEKQGTSKSESVEEKTSIVSIPNKAVKTNQTIKNPIISEQLPVFDQEITITEQKIKSTNFQESEPTIVELPETGTESDRELALPKTICLNDELIVSNPYKTRTISIKQAGKTSTISPGNKLKINTSEAGKVIVQHSKEEVVVIQASKSKLSVDMDVSLMYENGIPSIKFVASGNSNAISWTSNVSSAEVNQSAYFVHPYKERSVRVTAKTKDENGCPVEESKTILINEPYNLLAVTGFKPQSSDSRNNRFMPFALTQRETPFELVIFDPSNSGIVFRSSDALNGWDGTDNRSGDLVKEGTIWLWKVVMKSPNTGEPREYSGTITRL